MTLHFAWPQFVDALEWAVDRLTVDGIDRSDLIDTPNGRVRLDQVELWTRAELTSTMRLPGPTPPGLSRRSLRMHGVLSCPSTSVRIPFPLAPVDDDIATGTLTISHDEVSGTGQLSAVVVDPEAGDAHGPRVVGDAPSWTIVVDAAEAPAAPGGIPLRTAWIGFENTDAPHQVRAYPGAPAFLDLSVPDPVLYLNENIAGLKHLLNNEKARLEKRRLRDLLGTGIAQYAIGCLVRAAVDAVVDDGSGVGAPPTSAALRQVCDALAETVQSVADVDDLYRRVLMAREAGGTELQSLWAEFDLAVFVLSDQADVIRTVSEEVQFA